MSITTTCGRSRRASSNPAAPSAAPPITSIPSTEPSSALARRRAVHPFSPPIDLDRETAILPSLGETNGILAEGLHKANFVQRRWAQAIHQAADLGDRRADFYAQLFEELGGCRGVSVDEVASRVGLKCHRGQHRSQAVVQIPADAAPLLLLHHYEPLS